MIHVLFTDNGDIAGLFSSNAKACTALIQEVRESIESSGVPAPDSDEDVMAMGAGPLSGYNEWFITPYEVDKK